MPEWNGRRHDLGLIRLAGPVKGVAPLALASVTGSDELSVDQLIILAGRGDFGDGETGVVGNDQKFRRATNRIAEVEADRFVLEFDAPGPDATDTEGISGPGDSGTPALLSTDDGLRVVGIGSMGRSPDGGGRYGEYGSRDIFVRVSHYRPWIADAMSGKAARYEPPEPPAGALETALSWVEAYNAGTEAMRGWLTERMSPRATADRGIDQRLDRYREMSERTGALEHLETGDDHGPFAVVLRMRDAASGRLDVGFELDENGKVEGVALMRFD